MAHDIYTEPEGFDLDTLANLGPLAGLAGTWEGQGSDTHPVAEQDTVLQIAGRAEPFHHTDRNVLRRVAPPRPNPVLAAGGGQAGPDRAG